MHEAISMLNIFFSIFIIYIFNRNKHIGVGKVENYWGAD